MLEISDSKALAFRLRRHHLAKPASKKMLAEVTGDICGIQSQLYSAAQVSLGIRHNNLKPEHIDKALWEDRVLAKFWMMRQTVHIFPTADHALYTSGLGAISDGIVAWALRNGMKRNELEKVVEATIEVLENGILSRKEIVERVKKSTGKKALRWLLHSWGGLMKIPVMRGEILFGPSSGGESTFVRKDFWIGKTKSIPTEEAQEEIFRRYLKAFGPAKLRDFGYWSMLRVGDARKIYSRIQDEIGEVSVDGEPMLILEEDIKKVNPDYKIYHNDNISDEATGRGILYIAP